MTMKKLTDRLSAELSEKEKAARKEHTAKEQLAALWDAHIEAVPAAAECIQPWFLHTSHLYGSIGSFAFKEATPEDCAALLAAFPAVSLALVRSSHGTGVRPEGYVKEGEKIETSLDIEGGATMRMDRTGSYPTRLSVEWYTRLDGKLVRMDVDLENIYGVTPMYTAHVQYDSSGQHIVRVTNAQPQYAVTPVQSLKYIRYSAGSATGFGTLLIYGNVRAYIEQLAGYCYSQRRASKKAYQEDKIAGLPPVSAPASDQTYDNQKLRAGTREQYECLHSEAARKDRALAEKHWKCYAEDYGIKSSREKYFDHFAWACAYLKRQGLYEVSDPRDTNYPPRTYKYGNAWL